MKTKLKLYRGTLDWEYGNPEAGDFCEKVWAKDAADAVKELANRMADSQELTGKERREFIADRIAEAGSYAAEDILVELKDSIYDLLVGPKGTHLTKEQERVKCVILDLLHLYGV